MKALRSLFAAVVAASAVIFSASAFATDWHSMTQTERDHAILFQGNVDIGKYEGQCKTWIQARVVPIASAGAVSVPPNYDPTLDYMWKSGTYLVRSSLAISDPNVHVGTIVQMRIHTSGGGITPHTAIISLKDANGITWLESNYYGNGGVTNTRHQTYQEFYNSLENSNTYSLYNFY